MWRTRHCARRCSQWAAARARLCRSVGAQVAALERTASGLREDNRALHDQLRDYELVAPDVAKKKK